MTEPTPAPADPGPDWVELHVLVEDQAEVAAALLEAAGPDRARHVRTITGGFLVPADLAAAADPAPAAGTDGTPAEVPAEVPAAEPTGAPAEAPVDAPVEDPGEAVADDAGDAKAPAKKAVKKAADPAPAEAPATAGA